MQTQPTFLQLRCHLESIIVGQTKLLDRLLIAVLSGGHILLEGLPGLAKTRAVTALASGIHASFQRIQFTPDLMPADLTGSDIFNPNDRTFNFITGPLFHEIVLADEINRAPPKVQSALLEAMQEHQITVGGVTRDLPDLFIVMATQNPLEQSGTYPLPEAQLDRFLLHVVLDYPSAADELLILQRDQQSYFGADTAAVDSALKPETVLAARREVAKVHIEEVLEKYIIQLVGATRELTQIDDQWQGYLRAGASPRASIALLRASSALAYLNGREYVIPEDIVEMAPDVLRHRIVLNHTARTANVDADAIIQRILAEITVP
ncbi:MAG: MoxR family ATPase [Thiotrichaceae bacterium]|nr:MoxR family ATPase [Thiotrichaceae bacterium]